MLRQAIYCAFVDAEGYHLLMLTICSESSNVFGQNPFLVDNSRLMPRLAIDCACGGYAQTQQLMARMYSLIESVLGQHLLLILMLATYCPSESSYQGNALLMPKLATCNQIGNALG